MNREPKGYDGITPYRTFFKWHLCCCYGLEFRRENGWVTNTWPDTWPIPHYICETCAPDRASAAKIANMRPWIPPMPKVAP